MRHKVKRHPQNNVISEIVIAQAPASAPREVAVAATHATLASPATRTQYNNCLDLSRFTKPTMPKT